MCLWGSPISTHGNYACCSNRETKLPRQGVIVGCWQGAALVCGRGLSGERGGLETHKVCLCYHREGWHLGWLLGRGGEKGKTKAWKAIVLKSTCVTSHHPLPPAGHFMEQQASAALSEFRMPSSSLLFIFFWHFYLSRWSCLTQLGSAGLSITAYGLWPLRSGAAVWETAHNHQGWQIC